MQTVKKYSWSVCLFLILLFGTYYFVLKDYSIQTFFDSVSHCHFFFLFLAFLALFGYCFFAAVYFKRILKYFGKKINWYQAFGYHFTEVYFSAITPSSIGGQPVQMVEMNKDHIPYRISTVLILLNTLIYKIALLTVAVIGFVFCSHLLFSQNALFVWLFLLGFITTVFLILFFLALVYSKKLVRKTADLLFRLGRKLKLKKIDDWQAKFEEAFQGYQECAKLTKQNPRILLEAYLILLCQRVCLLSICYFIYLSFGLREFNIIQILAFQSCITLASDFMPFPGGLVVSEGLLLQINQFIYGSSLATSAMILFRSVSFYFIVIFSGIFYLFFHFMKRKKANDFEIEGKEEV